MAQRVQVLLTDDLDGSPGEETVRFALDGKNYEIDLSAPNAERLRTGLAEFVDAARRAPGSASAARRAAGGRSVDRDTAREIRTWAAKNGVSVADRGRIPGSIILQYQMAMADAGDTDG